MALLSHWLHRKPRQIKMDALAKKLTETKAEAEEFRGRTRNNIQAIQSGARTLQTMSGMMKLVGKKK